MMIILVLWKDWTASLHSGHSEKNPGFGFFMCFFIAR